MIDRTQQFPAVQADTAEFPTPELGAQRPTRRRVHLPAKGRRPAFLLAAAAAGAVVVNLLAGGQPPAEAETSTVSASHSVAEALGIAPQAAAEAPTAEVAPDDFASLEDLAASRGEREAAEASAAQAQAAAEQAERDRLEAERLAAEQAERDRLEAERVAAERAAQEAAEREAAERAAREAERAPAAPAASGGSSSAPSGSFKEYAMSKVGSADQFSCLENLWGKESGWNPNAQNPTSTAYGIPQFLNSTWAGTGIAKTSDGYRQIDAGLIYIENRYGSPCAAWAHSKANNWY
ncbi:lytic transglycosylase domain-containing protein [Geodermatophilus sp. CPCC 206100]|uniref:aggregation-promoting factor C-terminal-like domain-containing protein n=1 Tax=Geodermatophilus sp. CPCC 206100 TaxID=3020054 RepID=UPI003B002895